MAHELLPQSRKLNKWRGGSGGRGRGPNKSRGVGEFLEKNKRSAAC